MTDLRLMVMVARESQLTTGSMPPVAQGGGPLEPLQEESVPRFLDDFKEPAQWRKPSVRRYVVDVYVIPSGRRACKALGLNCRGTDDAVKTTVKKRFSPTYNNAQAEAAVIRRTF